MEDALVEVAEPILQDANIEVQASNNATPHVCPRIVGIRVHCNKCNADIAETKEDLLIRPVQLMAHLKHGWSFVVIMDRDVNNDGTPTCATYSSVSSGTGPHGKGCSCK